MTRQRRVHPVVGQLAAYRVIRGLPLAEVARRMLRDHAVKVSADAIWRWEHGISDPLLQHLDAYAAVLDSNLSVTAGKPRRAKPATQPADIQPAATR